MASSNILVTIQTPFRHKNVLLPRGKQFIFAVNNNKDMMELYELMINPHSVQGVYMSDQDRTIYDKYLRETHDSSGNKLFRDSFEMVSSYLEPPSDPEDSPFLNPVVISRKDIVVPEEKKVEQKIEKGISELLIENKNFDKNKEYDLNIKEIKEETKVISKEEKEEEQKKELKEEITKRFNHLISAHYTKIQDRAAELDIEYTVKDKTILEIIKIEFQDNVKQLKLEEYLEVCLKELINSK